MTQQYHHLGVYGLIIDHASASVLLIRKARGPYTGLLDLPGGSPEPGETPLQTLYREIQEETGAEVATATELKKFEISYHYVADQKPFELLHTCHVFQATLKTQVSADITSSDSSGCVWMPIKILSLDLVTPPVLTALEVAQHE